MLIFVFFFIKMYSNITNILFALAVNFICYNFLDKSVLAIFKLLGFKFVQDVYEDRIDDDILSLVESRDKDRQNNDWHKADKKKYLIEQRGLYYF